MRDESRTGISKNVETVILGILRFLEAYLNTHWQIARHPVSFCDRLIADNLQDSETVEPLTYLAFGGFVFTVCTSAVSYGPWDMFNESIWIYEDIIENLQSRWKEAFSVTTLLLSSFPVLLTVGLFSRYFGVAIHDKHAMKFSRACAYSFGFLSFFYFSFHLLGTIFVFAKNLGFDSENLWELPGSVWWVLAGFGLTPLLTVYFSLAMLIIFSIKIEKISPSKAKWRVLITPIFFLVVFIAMSYAAAIPGTFVDSEASESEVVENKT